MNKEDCCVCFSDNYVQNDMLICNHALCINCYEKLNLKQCPICRSFDKHPFILIQISNIRNLYIPLPRLHKFCLYSHDYSCYMKRHLKNRVKQETLYKVNRLLGINKFIFYKNNVIHLSEMTNDMLIKFILNNTFSELNKKIIYQLLTLRFSLLS